MDKSQKDGRAQKVTSKALKDKAKEYAKRDKQDAPKAAKPSECLHCRGFHTLAEFLDLTEDQLEQIHIQLVAHEEGVRRKKDGDKKLRQRGIVIANHQRRPQEALPLH